MPKKVRIGIVGAGSIGRCHADSLQETTGGEIAAICDVHEGRAKALAKKLDTPQVYTDYRDLLAAGDLDAVWVCTPNNLHMPVTLAALKAGMDVVCEKPVAMDAREARRMVAAADAAGKILMVAQSSRYTSTAKYLKKLAQAGDFGEIYYGKALWLRRAGIPKGWFQDAKQAAAGPLIDLGVHAIDLLWWLMGQPKPVSAYGVTFDYLGTTGQGRGDWGVGYNPAKFSVEDMIGAMVRFEDGRALSIDISWAAHTGDLYWLRFFGTKGGAEIHPQTMVYRMDGDTKVDSVPQLRAVNQYAVEDQHFIDCVRNRRPPISSGSQAVVVMEMLDAIGTAARTGRMATVKTA
jgi:predicted dehydrogenase